MKKTKIFQHIFSTCFQSHRTSRKQSRDKKTFFITFKKVTFSVCRILNAKTKKSEVFLKHFFNIDFIWGKSTFPKIAFLPFVSSININVFYWKYSFLVLLWLSILFIFRMLQIIKFRCFEAIILQKKLFWDQKTYIFDPN